MFGSIVSVYILLWGGMYLAKIAVDVDENGNLKGSYKLVYDKDKLPEGWEEVEWDPLGEFFRLFRYKIDDTYFYKRLVFKRTGMTSFEELHGVAQGSLLQIAKNALTSQNNEQALETQGKTVSVATKDIADLKTITSNLLVLTSTQQMTILNLANQLADLKSSK